MKQRSQKEQLEYLKSLKRKAEDLQRVHCVYYMVNPDTAKIKIGHSKDPRKRLRTLSVGVPRLRLLAVEDGDKRLEAQRKHEFRACNDAKEWFYPTQKLIDHIRTCSTLHITNMACVRVMTEQQIMEDRLRIDRSENPR